jgi:hypothetical protein
MPWRFVEMNTWLRRRFAIVVPSGVFANEDLMIGWAGRRQSLLTCPHL